MINWRNVSSQERLDKVIFLDYDGVLNSYYYHANIVQQKAKNKEERTYEWDFDPKKVKILKEICKKTGAYVIITSSWRNDEKALVYLRKRGVRIYGVTSEALRRGHRGDEIRKFLAEHDVGNYIILDDESSDFDDKLMAHTIITRENWDSNLIQRKDYDCFEGLQEKHIKWAISMLNS